jgi:UDP-N-acetylglucosamine 2-epimerase (non-hydrolysing)
MSNKLKILTVVGTRPEIIRLSRIISELDSTFDHHLAHTGQNYDFELNEIFFNDLKIRKPNYFLSASAKTPSETIGNVIIKTDRLIRKVKPDAIFILGDTNSCLSVIAAKKNKVPIFHYEAGNRSFDQRIPEEINRKIVDHIADIHLTYSKISREYLLKEGVPAETIINIGSPMKEVINFYMPKIKKATILRRMNLKKNKFFLVSFHREENVDTKARLVLFSGVLNELAEKFNMPIILSTHPRTSKKLIEFNIKFHKMVELIKPLSFTDYISMQIAAKVVLSDSGTISEESSILNFDAINLRDTHERPEAMEQSTVIMTGLNKERVMEAINFYSKNKLNRDSTTPIVHDYDVDCISKKISKIILSHVDYVNNFIWKKS